MCLPDSVPAAGEGGERSGKLFLSLQTDVKSREQDTELEGCQVRGKSQLMTMALG